MKMVQDYYDAKSSEDSAEELNKMDREEILTVTINGSSDAKERRKRREIANSNERRRMQSINAGFQTLRGLLPGNRAEKLSKAAILQKTADLIYQLKQDKIRTIRERNELKELLTGTVIAPLKRLKSYQNNLYHYHHHHHSSSNSSAANRSRHHQQQQQRYEHHQNHHSLESMSSDECLDDCLSADENPSSPASSMHSMDIAVEKSPKESSSKSSRSSFVAAAIAAADFNSFDVVEELRTKLLMERSRRLRLEDQIRHMDPNLFYQHPPEVHHVEEVLSNNSGNDVCSSAPIEIRHLQQKVPKKLSRSVSPVVGGGETSSPSLAQSVVPPLLPQSTVTNMPLVSPPVSAASEIRTALPFVLQKPQLMPSSAPHYVSGTNSSSSILEAVLKCEPKVEVESLLTLKNRPLPLQQPQQTVNIATKSLVGASSTIPITTTTTTAAAATTTTTTIINNNNNNCSMNNLPRQNLETIVEAIRRLEGDMFSSNDLQQQQRPGVIVTQQKQQQPQSQPPYI